MIKELLIAAYVLGLPPQPSPLIKTTNLHLQQQLHYNLERAIAKPAHKTTSLSWILYDAILKDLDKRSPYTNFVLDKNSNKVYEFMFERDNHSLLAVYISKFIAPDSKHRERMIYYGSGGPPIVAVFEKGSVTDVFADIDDVYGSDFREQHQNLLPVFKKSR